MRYKASHRHADMSPRKIRPFAQLIRGRAADEALELLRFLPNKSARLLEQVLKNETELKSLSSQLGLDKKEG